MRPGRAILGALLGLALVTGPASAGAEGSGVAITQAVSIPQAAAPAAPRVIWTRQFGSKRLDRALAVGTDRSGNIYVGGVTAGDLLGLTRKFDDDAYLRKVGPGGDVLWTRQFGSADDDRVAALAVDDEGNIYVAGWTDDTLPGQVTAGDVDAYLQKVDPAGGVLWTRQFGSDFNDYASSVAVDREGNAYVAGSTTGSLTGDPNAGPGDAFLRVYSSGGDVLWTRQFGTADDDAGEGVAVDGDGNAYVAGWTGGTLPGQQSAGRDDAYLRKFGPGGDVLWTRQFGTAGGDIAYAVAVDSSGNAYITGSTLLRKYGPGGNVLWQRPFGGRAVAVDGRGRAYVSGHTTARLPGQKRAGRSDAFLRVYSPGGKALWTNQFGTPEDESGEAVAVDSRGNTYVGGYTHGSLPGNARSGYYADAFLRRYAPTRPR